MRRSQMLDKLPKYRCSLTVRHNAHKGIYESVEAYINDVFQPEEWVSEADFHEALATDNLWHIHWYPDTPVGSCDAYGSTLENALKASTQEIEK
jgi:hypothetical protein